MKKTERVLYLAIIIFQCILICFSFVMYQKQKEQLKKSTNDLRLYSFPGIDANGEKRLVHFTAYSGKYYLFLILSANCGHCIEFQKRAEFLFSMFKENNAVEIIILMAEPNAEIAQAFPTATILKVDHDDLIQFGTDTPAVYAVNGQGQILIGRIGYREGLFEEVSQELNNAITMQKTSKIIR